MERAQASMLSHEDLARILQTNLATGLASFEARERLKKYGHNLLEGQQSSSIAKSYILQNIVEYSKQFINPLIQLLLICVVISIVVGEYANAVSVAISILLVCTISYIQERRADKSLEKLNKQIPNICKVVRESRTHEIESQFLVPGDVIHLTEGQRVPADVRLFDLHSMSLDESNLTGETQPQAKSVAPVSPKAAPAAPGGGQPGPEGEADFMFPNLALMGTMVESGHSRGIVICTGKQTRYGQVFDMLKTVVQPRGPLLVNIDQLGIHLVVFACSVIAAMSILGIIQQRASLEVSFYALSLAVTAIPEGLPVVVAVIMALGVFRLSKRKTIVKSLNSIETLGCIQVLCADKTGTLTRNDMSLTDIVTSELHSLSSKELEELNSEQCRRHMTFNNFGGKMYSIGRLMEVGTLCNNASVDPNGPANGLASHYIGQATECAILDAAIRMGFGDSRTKFSRLAERPFSSGSRRMAVQCQRLDLPGNSPMFYVKGAWEEILEDCSHYYECGLVKARSSEMWLEYARICTALGSQGLRVLALATGQQLEQLTFVGVVGIRNSPRDGIAETLAKLRTSFHIEVKMITGDSRATAVAVGRSLGLIEGPGEQDETRAVMSGDELQRLLKSDLDDASKAREIGTKSLFYRVDPVQKANIVSKLQDLDKVVAMTGDGVNDVISLKRANLGIAMGTGADVCKEVADVILVDNDLSVLVSAVIEGKGIYYKIQSFLTYQISISLSLIILIASSFALRIDSPFTVIQLLFINLLTDGPPAQSLGMEKIHERDLDARPRNVHEPLLSLRLLGTVVALTTALVGVNGFLYYLLLENGKLDDHAKALIFTCFVFCSIFAAVSLRSKLKTIFEIKVCGNKELFYTCSIVVAIQVIIIQVDGANDFFGVSEVDFLELLYLFLYSTIILFIVDITKILSRVLKVSTAKRVVDFFVTRKIKLAD